MKTEVRSAGFGSRFRAIRRIGFRDTSTPCGNTGNRLNPPYSSGAVHVIRWTSLHAQRLREVVIEAIMKPGFTFIKDISPCPTNDRRRNGFGDRLDEPRRGAERSVVSHGVNPAEADLIPGNDIIVGGFIDEARPTFLEACEEQTARRHQFVK